MLINIQHMPRTDRLLMFTGRLTVPSCLRLRRTKQQTMSAALYGEVLPAVWTEGSCLCDSSVHEDVCSTPEGGKTPRTGLARKDKEISLERRLLDSDQLLDFMTDCDAELMTHEDVYS